jgi:NADPH-dependent curcumin reductase CurA
MAALLAKRRARSSVVDAKSLPIQAYLGALGMPGVTAWYGLNRIIEPKSGETVLVSAATGAVGSVVGQLAKLAGARPVGIAGGKEKCAYAVNELGYAACVDHNSTNFAEELKAAVPNGIDGLFENVGGEPFQQALDDSTIFRGSPGQETDLARDDPRRPRERAACAGRPAEG